MLAGGTEAMSSAPYLVRGVRFGAPLFQPIEFEDLLHSTATDQHISMMMGATAEKLGEQYSITREECDRYAHKSQTRWHLAQHGGYFKKEIEPMQLLSTGKKPKNGNGNGDGSTKFSQDEHPRETSEEALARLPPVFKRNGLVTAGNASVGPSQTPFPLSVS